MERGPESAGQDGIEFGMDNQECTYHLVVHSVPLDPSNSIAETMATLLTQMSILTKKVEELGQKQQAHRRYYQWGFVHILH